jgi:hypothetical protein
MRFAESAYQATRANRLGVAMEPFAAVPCLRSTFSRGYKMSILLIIIVLVVLFGGGGGYYAHRSYGGTGLGGVLGLVLIVVLVIWLLNRTTIGV